MKYINRLAMIAAGTIAFIATANAYNLTQKGQDNRTVSYMVKCADGKEHWLHQRKSDGQWCVNAGAEICRSSAADIIRSQYPSCQ